jgi:hypothetical protein
MKVRIFRCLLGLLNLAIVVRMFVPILLHPLADDGMLERGLDYGGTALLTLTAAFHLLFAIRRPLHRGLTIGLALIHLLLTLLVGWLTFEDFFSASRANFALDVGILSVLALNAVSLYAGRNAIFDAAETTAGGD